MENATKALMIAGAVLIAIMIIGIGMMIYTSASNTINDSMDSVDAIARDSFNAELLAYEGTQKGTNVKALITKIISLNAANADTHPERTISVTLDGAAVGAANLSTTRATGIVAGKTYTVTTAENTTKGEGYGYITTVAIEDANKPAGK